VTVTAGGATVAVGGRDQRVAGALLVGAAVSAPVWSSWFDGVPCGLRALTGIPCPLCGMTTSVVATVQGRVGDAVAANPFGILVVVAAVLLVVTWRRGRVWRVPVWLPWAGLGLSEVWQLFRFL